MASQPEGFESWCVYLFVFSPRYLGPLSQSSTIHVQVTWRHEIAPRCEWMVCVSSDGLVTYAGCISCPGTVCWRSSRLQARIMDGETHIQPTNGPKPAVDSSFYPNKWRLQSRCCLCASEVTVIKKLLKTQRESQTRATLMRSVMFSFNYNQHRQRSSVLVSR